MFFCLSLLFAKHLNIECPAGGALPTLLRTILAKIRPSDSRSRRQLQKTWNAPVGDAFGVGAGRQQPCLRRYCIHTN